MRNQRRIEKWKMQRGFSLIEVILAAALFITFATAATVAIISGYNANRQGAEFTIANQFAAEGIEAVKSIKNQAYSNLTNTAATGVDRNGTTGVWQFGGASDTLSAGKTFTRVLSIASANRDTTPPNGNIVASGTTDPDTKKVTSTVTWNFNSARPESISLVTYLTDWRKAITSLGDGLLVYDDGSTTPKYKTYDDAGGSFATAADTVVGSSGRFFSMRTSPTKKEAIVGYINASGTLQIMCFDGTTWTNEWSVSVGGTGTTKRFDLAYETNSGDVMVVYSRGVAATNALAYRTKSGSSGCGSANWAAATNFATTPAATTGTVQWVKMARNSISSSTILSVLWADSNADLGANNWSGSAWATGTGTFKALDTNLDFFSVSGDSESFDIVYEAVSGSAMAVWGNTAGGNGTNGARYARCTGNVYTCSWTTATTVPTVSEDIHNIDMSANPDTNQIAYAAIGDAGDDLTAAYWSGTTWTGYANLDTSAESPFAGSRLVSTAWLINGATTRWILTYDDSTGNGISWYRATPGSTPVQQTDITTSPSINDIRERYDADFDPIDNSAAVITVSDSTRAIFAKKAVMDASGNFTWTNADGGASLGTTSSVPPQGFIFQYWRFP